MISRIRWLTALLAIMSSLAAAGGVALGQQLERDPERANSTVVESEIGLGESGAGLNARLDLRGHRIADLEIFKNTPTFGSATLINKGQPPDIYANDFSREEKWVHGKTLAELSADGADGWRIIDLEPYIPFGTGSWRYAASMVRNVGVAQKQWWFYTSRSASELQSLAAANGARITDLEGQGVGHYSAVMIANAGVDSFPWDLQLGVTAAAIEAHSMRPLDIEPAPNGLWNAILVADQVDIDWRRGLSQAELHTAATYPTQRVIDLEREGATTFSALVMNSVTPASPAAQALVNQIRSKLGTADFGFFASGEDGPPIHSFQAGVLHEPGSAIKVLALLYALREVEAGHVSLSGTKVEWAPWPECDNGKVTDLRTALEAMMKVSDNAATHGVIERFGRKAINDFAAQRWPGMRIRGCGVESGRSDWSLSQMGELYSDALDGTLLRTRSAREAFRTIMQVVGLDVVAPKVLAEEAERTGLDAGRRFLFRGHAVRLIKGGSLAGCRPTPAPCSPPTLEAMADSGVVEVPFIETSINRGVTGYRIRPRRYPVGFFLENVAIDCTFQESGESRSAYMQRCPDARDLDSSYRMLQGELARIPIRRAMKSWSVLPAGFSPRPEDDPPDQVVDARVLAKNKQRQKRKRRIRLTVQIWATEGVSARAAGKIRLGKRKYRLARKSKIIDSQRGRLRIKPKGRKRERRIAKQLRGGSKARAKIVVRLRDYAENTTNSRARVRLLGPRRAR